MSEWIKLEENSPEEMEVFGKVEVRGKNGYTAVCYWARKSMNSNKVLFTICNQNRFFDDPYEWRELKEE